MASGDIEEGEGVKDLVDAYYLGISQHKYSIAGRWLLIRLDESFWNRWNDYVCGGQCVVRLTMCAGNHPQLLLNSP